MKNILKSDVLLNLKYHQNYWNSPSYDGFVLYTTKFVKFKIQEIGSDCLVVDFYQS